MNEVSDVVLDRMADRLTELADAKAKLSAVSKLRDELWIGRRDDLTDYPTVSRLMIIDKLNRILDGDV